MTDQTGKYRQKPCMARSWAGVLTATVILGGSVLLSGCAKKSTGKAQPATPPPTFTGPAFLRGTVGSLTQLRGYAPLLVSGYGLVVGLNGSGSSEVPAYLRRWMINDMRKKGVGSAALRQQGMTPERLLANLDTSVVVIQGLIPPGAVKGERFDVLVSCLPQTQTTNLESGRLWTADLSVNGADPSMQFRRKRATASGPMYINPFDDRTPREKQLQQQRQAVLLSGGVVTTDRQVELILNQPSWQRSRLIADSINERFPKAPTDRLDTAVPFDDLRIAIHCPARFAGRTEELLRLISHLYTQRSVQFGPQQAQRLADLIVAQPLYTQDAVYAWQAMGKTILPVIRPYYSHTQSAVRRAVLETGARLGDETVSGHLQQLAKSPDTALRQQAATILVHLPRSIRGARTLHQLLDDDDPSVRLAAYESLATINDPVIQRIVIDGPGPDQFKFVLDLVPAKKPLVYIAQNRTPRLVIFNPMLGFKAPAMAHLWENRLMLRVSDAKEPITVFYQRPGQIEGQTFQIQPVAAKLVYLLAHRPRLASPEDGLNLTYSQTVNAVYQLCRQGIIPADTRLQMNPLAAAIAQAQQVTQAAQPRPETDQEPPPPFEDGNLWIQDKPSPAPQKDRPPINPLTWPEL